MDDLKSLGKSTGYEFSYTPEILETFENRHPGNDYWVKFNCPEFTSLCPITGQPDFAAIYISYIPDVNMVESKSLKLYLWSFREEAIFAEGLANQIAEDIYKAIKPFWCKITLMQNIRGGMQLSVVAEKKR